MFIKSILFSATFLNLLHYIYINIWQTHQISNSHWRSHEISVNPFSSVVYLCECSYLIQLIYVVSPNLWFAQNENKIINLYLNFPELKQDELK